jgi:hypothetical protein
VIRVQNSGSKTISMSPNSDHQARLTLLAEYERFAFRELETHCG